MPSERPVLPLLVALALAASSPSCSSKKSPSSNQSPAEANKGKPLAPTTVAASDAAGAQLVPGPQALPASTSNKGVLLLWGEGRQAEILGSLSGRKWRPAHTIPERELAQRIREGKSYEVTTTGAHSGELPSTMSWDCDHFVVPGMPGEPEGLLVVGSDWPLAPRPAKSIDRTPELVARASAAMRELGAVGDVEIDESLVADLDGDGRGEHILSVLSSGLTERLIERGEDPHKGDFTGVLVLPGGAGRAAWLGEIMDTEAPDFGAYSVAAAVDLGGQGRLDLVIHEHSFAEGSRLRIAELTGDTLFVIAEAGWGEVDCTPTPGEGWGHP